MRDDEGASVSLGYDVDKGCWTADKDNEASVGGPLPTPPGGYAPVGSAGEVYLCPMPEFRGWLEEVTGLVACSNSDLDAYHTGYSQGLAVMLDSTEGGKAGKLVRLPRGADGQFWTGDEDWFMTSDGRRMPLAHMTYRQGRSGGGWVISNGEYGYDPAQCRHATDEDMDVPEWRVCASDSLAAMSDERLYGHGLVRLPKDADGLTINTGDTVSVGGSKALKVKLVELKDGDWWIHPSGGYIVAKPDECRHVHDKPVTLLDCYGILKDSPDMLAKELDEVAEGVIWDCSDSLADRLHGIAARVRKLGGERDD